MANKFRYTAKGDDGKSSLIGQGRYSKTNLRFEALGTLDESSALIGLAKSMVSDLEIRSILTQVQRDLYLIMGEVSDIHEKTETYSENINTRILWLEEKIKELNNEVNSPGGFIVPGDSREDAVLDITRTVVRRAERHMIRLIDVEAIDNPAYKQYLNRLSSLIFTMELVIHHRLGIGTPTMAKGSLQ